MVHKPIAIMILPVFVAAVLIMGILATISSHSQVFADKSSKGYNNAAEESSNTGNAAQESSNTGNAAQESSNNGKVAQESSNNGKVAQESSNTGNAATTITPQITIRQNAHMTATNEQLSKNGRLTELTNVYPCRLELGKAITHSEFPLAVAWRWASWPGL